MAFLIPDNLKSRSDIPGAIRRVASAFQVALDDSAIVWYEPLYDPGGDKPHFAVLLPDRGIAVLEVLDVKASNFLGVLRGKVRFSRDSREVEAENPIVRAQRLAETLERRISAEPRLAALGLKVAAGAVMPSLSAEEAAKTGADKTLSADRCIYKAEVDAAVAGFGEAGLLRAFARMMGGKPAVFELNPESEKLLRGIIQPEIVIDHIGQAPKQEQLRIFQPPDGDDDVIRVMDRHQEAMAKSLGGGHRIIRGVAGSGKTLVLVYRAKLLARAFPQHKFLLTCYTRSLAGQLRELVKELPNVEVVHLDGLMADVIRQARLKHPGYKDGDGELVAQAALQGLQRVGSPRYDAVFLDEAQDFGTTSLRFVTSMLREGRDELVVVADAAQNIFRRKFSWKQAGIQAQGRTRILRVNYRNTKQILEFASRFLLSSSSLSADEVPDFEDENAVIPPESATREGPEPVLHVVTDVRAEVDKTVEQVKEWMSEVRGAQQIGVLYPGSEDSGVDRSGLLFEKLRAARVGVFWLSDQRDKTARDRLAQATEPVVLSTTHSAKGLEFPYVVLCGVWREGADVEENRKLAYVGMTRATKCLTVVTREGHPLVEDLTQAREGGSNE